MASEILEKSESSQIQTTWIEDLLLLYRGNATVLGELKKVIGKELSDRAESLENTQQLTGPESALSDQNQEISLALPANERAFFVGLSLGNLVVTRSRLPGNVFTKGYRVVVSTESKNPKRRQLLESTLGHYGEPHYNITNMKIFLPDEQFSFMVDREKNVASQLLDTKIRFPSFLLGLIAVSANGSDERLALTDAKLLMRINSKFRVHFGFEMGNVSERKDSVSSYIDMKPATYAQVMRALFSSESVRKLPFRSNLIQLSRS